MNAEGLAGRRLYVYYRVAAHDLSVACDAVRARQAELMERCPGLRVELLRRDHPRDGHYTLMEVYDRPGGIDEAAAAAIDRFAGAHSQWVVGYRTSEWFVPT